jgi:hypothetical protein
MNNLRLAWTAGVVVALAQIIIGVLPLEVGPRWIWLTIGLGIGIGLGATYPRVWGSSDTDSNGSRDPSRWGCRFTWRDG